MARPDFGIREAMILSLIVACGLAMRRFDPS